MRKEQFISFIDAPAMQQGESITQLTQLAKQFPYCQTAQLLLAKALHNENSIEYSDQLKVAAAYASDRKVLYQLIMSKAPAAPATEVKHEMPAVTLNIPENDTELLNNLLENEKAETPETEKKEAFEQSKAVETPKEETVTIEPPKEEPIEEAKEEVIEPSKEETIEASKEETVETPAITEEQKEEEIQPVIELPETVASETSITSDPESEIVNIDEISLLEKNILVEAIDASIELEVAENMPFRETEENIEIQRSETSETEKKETSETEKNETPLNTELPEEADEEIDPNKTYSFAKWLRLSQKAKAKAEASQKPEEKEQLAEEKEKSSEEQPAEKTNKRKTLDDLIDKFITEEPKITRPSAKQEFFSPVNMARQSVQDDNDFVTETLANIYLKQGSFAKAIKAYETLSLKFPEKKLYFAARIKEIKKIIKEQK